MDEQRLTLLLLPGMDGTGELFADFVKLLPNWIEPRVVNYPRDQKLPYDQLLPILKSALPPANPYVILAESFSTPLAVKFAAEHTKGLRALVLCAGFVLPPRRDLLARFIQVLSPAIFSFKLPKSVCRHFLVGETASITVVNEVCAAVSRVSGSVLAHRLRSVLSCNSERELRSVSVRLLYISGRYDRLVRNSSCKEIQQAKPDALVATVEAPHLILQAKPREAVDVIIPFLRNVQLKPDE
jgi:pimeloyl-ACP methyl ester carboxylesterase